MISRTARMPLQASFCALEETLGGSSGWKGEKKRWRPRSNQRRRASSIWQFVLIVRCKAAVTDAQQPTSHLNLRSGTYPSDASFFIFFPFLFLFFQDLFCNSIVSWCPFFNSSWACAYLAINWSQFLFGILYREFIKVQGCVWGFNFYPINYPLSNGYG